MKKHWYMFMLLLMALVINENVIQWALAINVGGYTVAKGFSDAFRYFNLPGYFLATALRFIPYAVLGMFLIKLSKTRFRDYVQPVLIGGLAGILGMIISGLWSSYLPLYTDEHASSTTPLDLFFIPIMAVFTGAIGAIVCAAIYTPIRLMLNTGEKKQD